MDNSNKVIIFLLIIILAIILFLGVKIIGDSKQTISGAVVEELNPKHEFYQEKIEEPEEEVEEEEIEELQETFEDNYPTEMQFETFKVVRYNSTWHQALIFYEINPEDIRCPISEPGPIIFFDETKTYLGYSELKDFLKDYGIIQLLAFGGDNEEALQDIRRETNTPIMVKFARGFREDSESEEPLYC